VLLLLELFVQKNKRNRLCKNWTLLRGGKWRDVFLRSNLIKAPAQRGKIKTGKKAEKKKEK